MVINRNTVEKNIKVNDNDFLASVKRLANTKIIAHCAARKSIPVLQRQKYQALYEIAER